MTLTMPSTLQYFLNSTSAARPRPSKTMWHYAEACATTAVRLSLYYASLISSEALNIKLKALSKMAKLRRFSREAFGLQKRQLPVSCPRAAANHTLDPRLTIDTF
jgi:hypothetical protein